MRPTNREPALGPAEEEARVAGADLQQAVEDLLTRLVPAGDLRELTRQVQAVAKRYGNAKLRRVPSVGQPAALSLADRLRGKSAKVQRATAAQHGLRMLGYRPPDGNGAA